MSEKNVEHWTRANADFTDAEARRAWAESEFSWGKWARPDAELGILGEVSGLDAVELGCGTAYDSARLARAGARVVGVDVAAGGRAINDMTGTLRDYRRRGLATLAKRAP